MATWFISAPASTRSEAHLVRVRVGVGVKVRVGAQVRVGARVRAGAGVGVGHRVRPRRTRSAR